MRHTSLTFLAFFTALLMSATGCGVMLAPKAGPAEPIQPLTDAAMELAQLPKPSGKMNAGVYGIAETTGQKKDVSGFSYSSAVPLDLTSFVVDSIERSGFFVPFERQKLDSLNLERQIMGGKSQLIPAQVLFEGAVIAYDTNVSTGGFALGWLGIIPKTQHIVDVVTVSLRAINPENGRIVQQMTIEKRVVSTEVRVGVFKFLEDNRLLESDIGYTRNQVVTRAIQEAFDRAVVDIIVQGLLEGTWTANGDLEENSVVRRFKERYIPYGYRLKKPIDLDWNWESVNHPEVPEGDAQ